MANNDTHARTHHCRRWAVRLATCPHVHAHRIALLRALATFVFLTHSPTSHRPPSQGIAENVSCSHIHPHRITLPFRARRATCLRGAAVGCSSRHPECRTKISLLRTSSMSTAREGASTFQTCLSVCQIQLLSTSFVQSSKAWDGRFASLRGNL